MPTNQERVKKILSTITEHESIERLQTKLASKNTALPPRIKSTKKANAAMMDRHWDTLLAHTPLIAADKAILADAGTLGEIEAYQHNIENCIGSLKIPLGVLGPLRINGAHAQGDYYVPLATSEATLVASYARGAKLISEAGGCSTAVLNDGLTRSPLFIFTTIAEAGLFVKWLGESFMELQAVAATTSRFGRLIDFRANVEGNHVYINFDFLTGDAAGQNMTTIATQRLCEFIQHTSPVKPVDWFVESNFSGDKKASALSFLSVRGKKVTAEVLLPSDLVQKNLHTTPERMAKYWQISALGGVMSGTMGVQGHFANGLAALYLATGQDVACVAESSIGVTRMELRGENLYVAVTLPNIIVGSVGGGTKLPSQQVGLKMLGVNGTGFARALAEICGAVCLAGELSLIGAICAGHFAAAHQELARG